MKHPLAAMMIASASFCGFTSASAQKAEPAATVTAAQSFKYTDEQFADIQMLRYKVEGFEQLTLKQKTFIYYLSEAALWGRDILFDQNGRYNLRIRQTLEALYTDYDGDRGSDFFRALSTYLKRVWFSSGIHHHYGCEKFLPEFSADDLRAALAAVPAEALPLEKGQTVQA
ncbi:MAG: dihydrofolate reductase, partial [Alloprevotella sp.]|nr:dihydrofolate reductase [Alloprevotella sp.]